jgi:two-component system phosphate regulon response regulator OmpR
MDRQSWTGQTPSIRVLVVDDDEDIRSALGRYLNLVGFQVEVAASGPEALALLGRSRYQVAVVDVRMPGMSGVEFVQLAHERWPDLAVVFLTGNATLDSAIAAVKAHAADYLLKPARAETVANAVAAAIGRQPVITTRAATEGERYLRAGLLTLDRQNRVVTVEGASAESHYSAVLTPSEMALLSCLMRHPRVPMSCRELAGEALHYDVRDKDAQSIVRPHISRLRKKIELQAARPRYLRTVPGAGYCLWPDGDPV